MTTIAPDLLVAGATAGAAQMAAAMRSTIKSAADAGVIGTAVPALNTVLADLLRVADGIAEIDRDTRAIVGLVSGSLADVKATAQQAATQLRQVAKTATAYTGRVEGSYQAGGGSVATDASLGNVVRAGVGLSWAATEAARQLDQLAAKIEA